MSKKTKKHPVRVPVSVAGGIRSQAGRGRHAHHWWGKRWIALLENLMPGPRLGRGRNYAASGQVAELQLGAGVIRACVQGANPQPYRVELLVRALDDAGRVQVLAALHHRPMLAARLLVRQLPSEVETIFREAGCPLFPDGREELKMECSCPDWTNLCKHAAAVNILLAEVIDRDPMLLLALRGIGREELLGGRAMVAGAPLEIAAETPEQADVLAADPAAFWGVAPDGAKNADPDFGTASDCAATAPLVRRLGPLPFWRGEERFLDAMHTVYARAAPRGWAVWSGESLERRRTLSKDTPAAGFHIRRNRLNMDLALR